MRPWIDAILKLYFGALLILTSLYCLLAYIPYTYLFLIKEPPYPWLIVFSAYHPWLYWSAVAAAVLVYWPRRSKPVVLAAWTILAALGFFFSWNKFLANIQNNKIAYFSSLMVLLPLLLLAALGSQKSDPRAEDSSLLCYSNIVIVALCVASFSAGGVWTRNYFATGNFRFAVTAAKLEMTICTLAAYLWLALLVVSLANLLTMVGGRILARQEVVRPLVLSLFLWLALSAGSARFLQNMLDFRGWPAYTYGITLAAALTGWGFTLLRPLIFNSSQRKGGARKRGAAGAMAICFCIALLLAPVAIGERDWNGILQYTFTLLFWIGLSISVYILRPRRKTYSVVVILAVLLLGGAGYWGFNESAFLWARHVGTTPGAIERAKEDYAAQNVSFDIADHWMSVGRTTPCGELCLILRQYTNIPNAELGAELKLVDHFVPSAGPHPNIFIFTIDSMRPDYLGAYNRRADFTPNLDAFARDSVVFHHAYTPYAGTTLAEPCIWSGGLLLHSHPLHPFERVNNLEKLVAGDGYQMVVSYDWVLRNLLSAADNLVKLDADKTWNHFEIGSTLRELESVLDQHVPGDTPVFFYAQPMNVHQFAVNDRPPRTSKNWTLRPGFNNRIAYEVHQVDESLGEFFQYLKNRGWYENSIIIITADHGDATQEFGRVSHSTIIYPEVMQVPLIFHLPRNMAGRLTYDPDAIASLIDIGPTLYYLLGHKPILHNLLLGRPLAASTADELRDYPRSDLLLASDARAAYGLLSGDGRFLYATYDSPAQSFLFDLLRDPNALHSVLSDSAKQNYDQRIIRYLHAIADFYGYKPTGGQRPR